MSDQTAQRRFFSSTTLERAVLEAAGHYGLTSEELAYSKIEKRGVASRGKVSIKVDPANPRRAEEAKAVAEPPTPAAPPEAPSVEDPPADEASADAAPASAAADEDAASDAQGSPSDAKTAGPGEGAPEGSRTKSEPKAAADEEPVVATSEPVELSEEMSDLPRTSAEARRSWKEADGPFEQAARKWTESLLRVASLDLEVEIYERDGELEIHLGGSDAEVAVEDGGEVLRAIQHLLPRLMLGTVGEAVHCRVDCNDFRELHEERLRAQAIGAAAEAVGGRGEVTLDPMHPADRRIVHLALADNELVRTESLGRGFFKRVSIRGN